MASRTQLDESGLEARYGLFGFHDEAGFERAEEFLRAGAAGGGPSVMLLSADGAGAGRGYFLEALAHRTRSAAAAPRVVRLDLTGFEPDRGNSLGLFLGYQLEIRELPLPAEERAEIGQALRWAPSETAAIVLALLLELGPLRERLAALAAPSPQEALDALLAELTAERPLLLHVGDFALLSEPFRRRLVALAEATPGLFVAFSTFGEAAERVAPGARHPLLEIEIEPLSQDELRQEIESRLAPSAICAEQHESLWKSTGGAPALAGRRLEELAARGVLRQTDGAWSFADGDLADEIDRRLIEIFSSEEDESLGQLLRSLLFYGALGGGVILPQLLLELMGVPEEPADEVVDLIDEVLVEQLGWLDDLEFRHPGFPGLQVYRFAHPGLAASVLRKTGAEAASAAASGLLPAMEKRLPAWTRSSAAVHLALSRHLGPAYRKPHLGRLAWWTGPEDAAELEALVRSQIAAGELDFATVWKVVESQGPRWPPFRRLPLLAAIEEPLADAHRRGLGAEHTAAYAAILAGRGEHGKACELQEMVLESRRRQFGNDHPETLSAMETLALGFYAAGEIEPARALQQQVLDLRGEVLGPDHPETLAGLWNLAVTLERQGEGELAIEMLRRAAADFARVLGARHPITRAVEQWLERQATSE